MLLLEVGFEIPGASAQALERRMILACDHDEAVQHDALVRHAIGERQQDVDGDVDFASCKVARESPAVELGALTPEARSAARPAAAAPSPQKRTTGATAGKPAVKKNCNPPFDIGKDGIKHFKPECF